MTVGDRRLGMIGTRERVFEISGEGEIGVGAADIPSKLGMWVPEQILHAERVRRKRVGINRNRGSSSM